MKMVQLVKGNVSLQIDTYILPIHTCKILNVCNVLLELVEEEQICILVA